MSKPGPGPGFTLPPKRLSPQDQVLVRFTNWTATNPDMNPVVLALLVLSTEVVRVGNLLEEFIEDDQG